MKKLPTQHEEEGICVGECHRFPRICDENVIFVVLGVHPDAEGSA